MGASAMTTLDKIFRPDAGSGLGLRFARVTRWISASASLTFRLCFRVAVARRGGRRFRNECAAL
eukprot:5156836-Pleurochrysis_carterae.AAC.1